MTTDSSSAFYALYYDGRSARARSVRCEIRDGSLHIEGEEVSRAEPLSTVTLSDQLGSAPRKLTLSDGASIEAPMSAELAQVLGQARGSTSWVAKLEASWRLALLALAISLAVIAAGYVWGLPLLAKTVAGQLPDGVIDSVGKQTLAFLDTRMLSPSTVTAQRQNKLLERLRAMRDGDGTLPRHTLLFRNGGDIGANALALPDGTVIVTDQLLELAGSDDEVLAVIGHELGHLHLRHALRGMIQGSIVAGVVAWYVGDFTSLAAGLPALLLESGYSRDFEREADRYGALFLRANGLSPALLANMLERLEDAHEGGSGPAYLSSHPGTAERAAALRNFRP